MAVRGDVQPKHDLFTIRTMVLVVTMGDFHGLGIFPVVGTDKGHAGRIVMHLLRFEQVHPNGIGAQLRHEALPVRIEHKVQVPP